MAENKPRQSEIREKLTGENSSRITHRTMLKAIFIIITNFPKGMVAFVPGPALPYLQQRVNASLSVVSQSLVIKDMGKLIASPIVGYMFRFFPHLSSLFLATSCIIGAMVFSALPWARCVSVLNMAAFLVGILLGGFNPGYSHTLLEILGPKGGTGLVAVYFARNLGGLIAPQLVTAFMIQNAPVVNATMSTESLEQLAANKTEDTLDDFLDTDSYITAEIEYTYGIIGFLLVICGFCFIIFFVLEKFEEHFASKVVQPVTCRGLMTNTSSVNCGKPRHNVFYILLNVMVFNVVGIQFLTVGYVYSFSLEGPHHFSATTSANLNSAFFLFSIAGLAVNAVLSAMSTIDRILTIQVVISVIASFVLTLWGSRSSLVFIIFICVLGLVNSSLDPLSLAWANLHVEMTAVATGFVFFSSGCGAALYTYLAGVLIDAFDYYMYLFLLFSGNLLVFVTFIILQLFTYHYSAQLKEYSKL